MDHDFVPRLQARLEELYELKFNALFSTQKDVGYAISQAEIVGYMRAIKKFGEIIAEEIAPKKKQEEEKNDILA